MLKKLAIATALVATIATPFTTAQAKIKASDSGRTVEQIYKQCGIGGALLGNSSEILAIISNVTWDLGTTAVISDAMSPETCSGGNVKAAVLINEAFPSVEKDLAAGNGAHLSALANVAGCESTDSIRTSYGNYTQTATYGSASQKQNVEALYSIVNNTCAM